MTEGILHQLPAVVAAAISQLLPDLRTCEATAGKFDFRRLQQRSLRAPAVMVSVLRIMPGDRLSGGHQTFGLQMAAFVVTRDAMSLPRDEAAATIVQAIMSRIAGTDWGRDDCDAASDLRAEAIVTDATAKADVSIWALTWSQRVAFEAIDPGKPLPIELYVSGPLDEDYREVTP